MPLSLQSDALVGRVAELGSLGRMTPSTTSPLRLRTAGKILRRAAVCLAVIGVFIFLVRPQGESEGDDRPITAAMYAVGFLIAAGVAGFIGTVFHHASSDDNAA